MEQEVKSLTKRQVQILELLTKGLTNTEICRFLKISTNTVKVHLANIYKVLEVSNRTEAAMVFEESKTTVNKSNDDALGDAVELIALPEQGLPQIQFQCAQASSDNQTAKHIVRGIANGLQKFEDIEVYICSEAQGKIPAEFQLKCEISPSPLNTLTLSLHHQSSTQIIWSSSIELDDEMNCDKLILQNTIHLHRNIEKVGARLFRKISLLQSHWWYGVMYCKTLLEHRDKDSWESALVILEKFHNQYPKEIFLSLNLANLWYKALFEQWAPATLTVEKISELANASMRLDSESQHSLLLYSIYSNVTQNYVESARYLEKCLEVNPLNLWSMQLLSQVYCLCNNAESGIQLMDKLKQVYPDFLENPNNKLAEGLFFFLNNQLEECLDVVEKIFKIIPDFLYNHLLAITTLSALGRTKEAKDAVEKLKRTFPDFNEVQLMPLFKGIHPTPLKRLVSGLHSAGLKTSFK